MSTLHAYASRDGAPSVGAEEEARQAAAEATPAVSAGTALAWARANSVKLGARGRCAAINRARLAAGLPPFKIDPRLTDPALPRLRITTNGAIVLGRERAERAAGNRESGVPDALRTALVAWLTAHVRGTADERVASSDHLREALTPLLGEMQDAVAQP